VSFFKKGRDYLLEHLVKIELFGKHYTFKAETDALHATEVADSLLDEIGKIESKLNNSQTTVNQLGIMIMTALNIANNNIEIKRNHSDFLCKISEKSANMIKKLDDCLM
jgi:cell division protein ZapA (FtsZ GTPase activity inhibitor)